ncbi:MAG: thioredoxin family protein [Bacteroidota bacterium]
MKKFTTLLSLVILAAFFSYHYAQAQGVTVGGPAVDFNLKNIDGKMVGLSDYASDANVKGVLVVFTCNHCPYSKLYEDRIVELDQAYKSEGFPVVAINPNDPNAYPEDDFNNMIKRAKKKGFTFPYLVDETQEIARGYGATRTPHAFLLTKGSEGDFEVAYIGAIDDNARSSDDVEEAYIEDAIAAVMNGATPEKETTKAIGCSIKWKK